MRLELKDFCHQFNDSTIGIELLCRMACIISKLTYQVFIARSHLVSWAGSKAQGELVEAVQQIADNVVWHLVLIGPDGLVAKDAFQTSHYAIVNLFAGIGCFYLAEGIYKSLTDILCGIKHFLPMGILRNLDGRLLNHHVSIVLTTLFHIIVVLLIANVADALKEHQRKDIVLVGCGIYLTTKVNSCLPEVALQFV